MKTGSGSSLGRKSSMCRRRCCGFSSHICAFHELRPGCDHCRPVTSSDPSRALLRFKLECSVGNVDAEAARPLTVESTVLTGPDRSWSQKVHWTVSLLPPFFSAPPPASWFRLHNSSRGKRFEAQVARSRVTCQVSIDLDTAHDMISPKSMRISYRPCERTRP